MSPQNIPSRQSERVPWSLRDCRALVALREAHPYDLRLASSFPPLPSPNRRLVLHPTLGRLGFFGKATAGHLQNFSTRTWLARSLRGLQNSADCGHLPAPFSCFAVEPLSSLRRQSVVPCQPVVFSGVPFAID